LGRDLSQSVIEQAPINARRIAVVQSAVYGGERWKQLLGRAAGDFVEILWAGKSTALLAAYNQLPGPLEQRKLVLRDRYDKLAASGIASLTALLLLEALDEGWIIVYSSHSKMEPGIRVTAIGLR